MPRQDPVKAAGELKKLKGIRFNVVGFDIGREDWGAQLQAMAREGGGRYWPASKADTLARELRSAVFGVPDSFVVLDSSGKEAGRGAFGQSLELDPAEYLFRARYAGSDYEERFRVQPGAATSVVFNAEKAGSAPQATVQPPATPDAKPRFCTACGKPVKPGAKFCAECGAKL
jgi:hypothetical protein